MTLKKNYDFVLVNVARDTERHPAISIEQGKRGLLITISRMLTMHTSSGER